MRLSSSPQESTVLRLEQRKSFSFAAVIRDNSGARVNLAGAVLTLDWLINPGRLERLEELQPSDVRTVHGTLVDAALGYVRFDVQAADLDSPAGSYPFTLTLRTADEYSVVIVKGAIELQMNPELASSGLAYAVGEPGLTLDVLLRGTAVLDVEVGSIVPPGTQFLTDADKAKIDLLRVEDGTVVVDLSDYVLTTTLASTVVTLEDATSAVATDLVELDGEVSSIEGRVDTAEQALSAAATARAAGFTTFTGEMKIWPGATAPSGWLLCQGQVLNRVDYPALFAVVGTAFWGGLTPVATQFRLPSMAQRVPLGADAAYLLGSYGGAATVTLDVTQMPSHTHTQNAHTHTQNAHGHTMNGGVSFHAFQWGAGNGVNVYLQGVAMVPGSPPGNELATAQGTANQVQGVTATNIATTATNQNTGGGLAHNNVQPYVSLNFIIKT